MESIFLSDLVFRILRSKNNYQDVNNDNKKDNENKINSNGFNNITFQTQNAVVIFKFNVL